MQLDFFLNVARISFSLLWKFSMSSMSSDRGCWLIFLLLIVSVVLLLVWPMRLISSANNDPAPDTQLQLKIESLPPCPDQLLISGVTTWHGAGCAPAPPSCQTLKWIKDRPGASSHGVWSQLCCSAPDAWCCLCARKIAHMDFIPDSWYQGPVWSPQASQ